MKEKTVKVNDDAGVHARPAMMLVREAMKYDGCEIKLIKDGTEADCKSIMSVLGLAMTAGSIITIRTEGRDEDSAAAGLSAMFESGFQMDR